MTRIVAPARLHFGLLRVDTPAPEDPCPRQFGGAGLMVAGPDIALRLQRSDVWICEGPHAERAAQYARAFLRELAIDEPACLAITIERAPPAHCGFGVGTALALAVGRAIEKEWKLQPLPIAELARRLGRGQRSGIGVHGFASGGFLIDGGKGKQEAIAPLLVRYSFPASWSILLVLPRIDTRWHGAREVQAFAHLNDQVTLRTLTADLSRMLLLGVLPCLVEQDWSGFGEALHHYNARSGEMFAVVQGGRYAHPLIEEIIGWLRAEGIPGVGQSSWGPAIFAVVRDPEHAEQLLMRLNRRYESSLEMASVTAAADRGYHLE